MTLSFKLPAWICDRMFPGMIDETVSAAEVHGEAKRSKRWLSGVVELVIEAKSIPLGKHEGHGG